MNEKRKKIRLAILSILRATDPPPSSNTIHAELTARGLNFSERTVRLYLQEMLSENLIERTGHRGLRITQSGQMEAETAPVIERVGLLSAKIDQMTYLMNYDLTTKSGTVVINMTLVDPAHVLRFLPYISQVFEHGYAMGELMTFLAPGEKLGHVTVPDGMVGLGTVCSITLNGVLLKYGIPTNSRFGGLLEIKDRIPQRFVEIIMYDGTSLDPLEAFIRSGMTDYMSAIRCDSGRIGASFREFPAESRPVVEDLAKRLKKIGMGGFMTIGRPSQSLLDIPVGEGRVGAIMIGGLNPVAILEENGIRAQSRALAGLIDASRLFHYKEMGARLKNILAGKRNS